QLEPQSVEDLLLKGRLESYHDPVAAEKTLDQAIALNKESIVARLIRGIVRARGAYELGEPQFAERALDDFRIASSLLEDNSYLTSELLSARLTAAAAYHESGELKREETHLAEAATLAEKLARYGGDYQAHRWRAFYFDQVGDAQQSLAEWRAIKGRSIGFLVMALYRAGLFSEAMEACDFYRTGAITGTPDFCHSFVQAAFCQSAEELEAGFQFDRIKNWDPNAAWRSTFILWCLAGRPDRARSEVEQIGVPDDIDELSVTRYRYLAGEIDSATYLQLTADSRYEHARALSVIGVHELAQGRRELARDCFQQSINYRFNYNFFTAMARALLAQLERSPQWPAWIPER
ncbi:MAG: hypothetical protein KDA61_18000, partial [Planctomycetales bacterium]|nr:hypothetical protein [Planctomycetales bacterium]